MRENRHMDQRKDLKLRGALNTLDSALSGISRIVLQLLIIVMLGMSAWLVFRSGLPHNASTDTAAIKLTADEVGALKKLLKPEPVLPTGGSKISIHQIRGLDDRLTAIEKVTAPGTLSLTASSDVRVVQRDLENLKDKEEFHIQAVKDQVGELATQTRWLLGTMVTLNLAIIGFFWQFLIKRDKSTAQ